MNNNIGAIIKKMRTDKQWSLNELSIKSGVAKTTLWGIERGSKTSLENLDKIATAFGISRNSFLDLLDSYLIKADNKGEDVAIEDYKTLNLDVATVKKLISDLSRKEGFGFNLTDDDMEFITSSLKHYLLSLVDYLSDKNFAYIHYMNNIDFNTTTLNSDELVSRSNDNLTKEDIKKE